jgi:hypothetical protein
MPKRKIREELKKEDFFLSAFEKWKVWIRGNLRTCIVGAVVVVLLGLSGWAYAAYQASKDEKAQYQLASGIAGFQEYAMANKADSLTKAEADFRRVAGNSSGGLKDAARLYLAQIATIKGNKEEARTLYNSIAKKPSNDISKRLAETGLKNLEKNG